MARRVGPAVVVVALVGSVGVMGNSGAVLYAQAAYPVAPVPQVAVDSANTQGQQPNANALITLEVKDRTVLWAAEAIAREARLKLLVNGSNKQLQNKISISFKGTRAMDALVEVLKGTGLEAKLASGGETVMIRTRDIVASEQSQSTGIITGVVHDSSTGSPISGATIAIAGTKLSALTNEKGEFTVQGVPTGSHVVTVRLVGYKSLSRTAVVTEGQRVPLRFTLVATTTSLAGVVTTATGMQRKLEIGNAIASINVDSVMRVTPITTLTDLLETRVPGLTVQRTSGTPGDPSRIRIRGSSSIERNNEPIVIVDGIRVYGDQSSGLSQNLSQGLGTGNIQGAIGGAKTLTPSPLDQIDPSSIETIDVFKGPSAAALYGSDAANGVIVITTKRGRAQPTQWTATVSSGIETLPGRYPDGSYAFGTVSNIIAGQVVTVCRRTDFTCPVDSVRRFQALNDPRLTVIGRGDDQSISLTTRGGVATMQYALTGSMGKQIGMLRMPKLEQEQFTKVYGFAPFSWMRRPEQYGTWGVSGTLSAQPGPRTSVTLLSSVYSSTQQRSSLSGAVKQLATTYVEEARIGTSLLLPNLYRRMLSESMRSQYTAQAVWTPVSWLPLNGTIGLNTNTRSDETLVPRGLLKTSDSVGRYAIGHGLDVTRAFNLNTRLPVPNARMTIATGFTGSAQTVATMNAQADTIPPGALLPTAFTKGSQSTRAGTTYGWFIEPQLNITSRFFVMPGIRLDNNGLAGSQAGVMGLPKMNFSWIASDESFFPLKRYMNLLRLRAAFGSSGVQPGPADRARTYTFAPGATIEDGAGASFSTSVASAGMLALNGLGNTQLRPERSVEVEGGFDTDFWNDRFHIEFTGYRKVKRDAIIGIPLAYSVGGGTVKVNIGEVRNTGLEAATNVLLLERKSVTWNGGMSMYRDNNLVVRLNPGQSAIRTVESGIGNSGETRITPGYPLFGRWVKPILGFADLNHNGVVEKNEVRIGDSVVYVGRQEPDYTMTFNSAMTLMGRVTINAIVDYIHGVTQINNVMNDASSPFGASRDAPLAQQVAFAGIEAGTSYGFVQNVNTLRFNSLAVSYNVPASLVRQMGGRSMIVSLKAKNLGMKTNYRGKDPLVGANPAGNSVIDDGQLPLPRTIGLSFQIGN